MRTLLKYSVLLVAAMVLLPIDGFAQGRGQQGQGGNQDQAQQREQVQEQKQIHVPATGNGPDSDIYGHEMMTVQERNQYREQLRLVESDPEAKNRFMMQHQQQMQARAKAPQGLELTIDQGFLGPIKHLRSHGDD